MAIALIKNIPDRITDSEVLTILKSNKVTGSYIAYIKDFTNIKDELLSLWLNVNVKTLRSYKRGDVLLKENLQEQVILLISLFKHGVEVFGTVDDFIMWLESDNFFLDFDKPFNYLTTVTGIRFIDDRLTAIEFGDNV